jgi:hypothetical protein
MSSFTKLRIWITVCSLGALCACQTDRPTQTKPAALDVRLSFGQNAFAIEMGSWMRLSMKLIGTAGDTTTAPASVVIVSRNPAAIRVDSGTKLQTTAPGSAWIVASFDTAGTTLVDSMSVDVVCTAELVPIFTPPAQTLAVGDSFTPSLKGSTCGGYVIITDTFHWSAGDSTIIRVDSLSGTTTGLRPGQTYLHANGVRLGPINGLTVTVRAP